MAHFAELDENNVVLRVLVVSDEDCKDANGEEKESIGIAHLEKLLGGKWLQTSYNGRIRGLYAGIGMHYDPTADVFYPTQNYPSWELNKTIWQWEAPTPYPTDGKDYNWNEETVSWKEIKQAE
jgi:hypothetical protein